MGRISLQEHVKRIKYLNGYGINEARYNLVHEIEEDDMPPIEPKPVDDEMDAPIDNVDSLAAGEDVPTPETQDDDVTGDEGIGSPDVDITMAGEDPMGGEEQQNPDEIQNEIIRKNIDVMKQLNSKIGDLENMFVGLNMEYEKMNKDMEEVREPTNVEKLTNKKQDSHPYYYGLNDMWEGNWFQARRDETGDKGMKQTEDGSYVADFDELPQMSSYDVKDSFNDY